MAGGVPVAAGAVVEEVFLIAAGLPRFFIVLLRPGLEVGRSRSQYSTGSQEEAKNPKIQMKKQSEVIKKRRYMKEKLNPVMTLGLGRNLEAEDKCEESFIGARSSHNQAQRKIQPTLTNPLTFPAKRAAAPNRAIMT